jgi:hypothetical protein
MYVIVVYAKRSHSHTTCLCFWLKWTLDITYTSELQGTTYLKLNILFLVRDISSAPLRTEVLYSWASAPRIGKVRLVTSIQQIPCHNKDESWIILLQQVLIMYLTAVAYLI